MVSSLGKLRNKLVHFIFPFEEHVHVVLSLLLLVCAWSVPETYWRIKWVLMCLWFIDMDIYAAGVMERDYLPIQPANSWFYHVYRFCDGIFILILLICLVIMLIQPPRLLLYILLGIFFAAVILRTVGDKKYRPKKPEEEEHFL